MSPTATREQVLAFRVRAQQLDRTTGGLDDTALLDLGVQDTGPDGGLWALANRGVDVSALTGSELATVWTLRGAPHLYRRADLPGVAAAVAPFSDADAGKRIYDASKPLKAAGITNLQALDEIADTMRSFVVTPMVKGEVSSRLNALLPAPYLRTCRPCDAVHLYEMPFRLAALRAGLELQAGTSPPVLAPIPDFVAADESTARFDVVRGYLRLLGPATPQEVAGFLDAPVKDVRAHWPDDADELTVDGQSRWILRRDLTALTDDSAAVTRLLGPFDLFLQARDHPTLAPDAAHAKDLWRTLGRPGGVLADGRIVGTWRPRKSGGTLAVQVLLWRRESAALRGSVEEQAQRLAAVRRTRLTAVTWDAA